MENVWFAIDRCENWQKDASEQAGRKQGVNSVLTELCAELYGVGKEFDL